MVGETAETAVGQKMLEMIEKEPIRWLNNIDFAKVVGLFVQACNLAPNRIYEFERCNHLQKPMK